MSILLNRLFGRRKITSQTVADEIAKQESTLAEATARLETAARGRIAALEGLDKAALRSADEAAIDARADIEIAERALTGLRQEAEVRKVEEERQALEARTEAAIRLIRETAPAILEAYDRAAADVVKAVMAFEQIETEVSAVNLARHQAGLRPISNASEMLRKEADTSIPERKEKRTKWFVRERDGSESEPTIYGFDEKGNRVPQDGHGNRLADAVQREVEVVVQAKRTRYGNALPSFETVNLPAGLIGSAQHWPRVAS